MTNISDIIELTDNYTIADYKIEISNANHVSSSSEIYTDGNYKYDIDGESGLIHIISLQNASYIAYLDRNNKVYLHIYRNIHDNMIKTVIDSLLSLRSQIEVIKQDIAEKDISKDNQNIILPEIDDVTKQLMLYVNGLVDLNNMRCDECGSTEFKPPVLCNDNKTIEYQCSKCYTIFRVIPSRYYALHSKTVFNDVTHTIAKNLPKK